MGSKALATKPAQVELLEPEKPEDRVTLAKETAVAIAGFMRGVVVFFTTAADLEKKANATLAAARTLTKPTDKASDEIVQRIAVRATAEIKAVENHWNPICSMFHNAHKWFVAGRQRPTGLLERAGKIANDFHNEYAAEDARRVAREAEQLRVDAERKAAADRQKELDDLEAAALKAEATSVNLSAREQTFVDLIVDGVTASQAAHRAGYKDTTRGVILLEQKKIQRAIEGIKTARAARSQAAAVAEKPLEVGDVATVESQIGEAAGSRSTSRGELLDEAALMDAFLGGKHGIPRDLWEVNPAKLNEYARSMGVRIELWPGVRYHKSTKAVGR